jgi:hypothetical protein
MEYVTDVIKERMKILGCSGKAWPSIYK